MAPDAAGNLSPGASQPVASAPPPRKPAMLSDEQRENIWLESQYDQFTAEFQELLASQSLEWAMGFLEFVRRIAGYDDAFWRALGMLAVIGLHNLDADTSPDWVEDDPDISLSPYD